ncbi:MAG TPA: GPW/gp25 family protein [Acidimicrobiales bacterium]|nr:GPW/gp25 family protein [Acidimicrobiales bacterium]
MEGDFLGTGWAFPPRVNGSGGIAMVRDERELEEAMRIVLLTYPGERPMRPEFGSRVRDFVFRETSAEMRAALAHEVRTSLQRWEPRVDVNDVGVTLDESDQSLVYLDVQYTPKATNDRRNLVFPFYTIPEDGSDY